MKLKYYMRGIGIGIILTTIILSFGNKKEALSDTEIITQARELGMVMKDEETDDNLKQVLEESLEKEDDKMAEGETEDTNDAEDKAEVEIDVEANEEQGFVLDEEDIGTEQELEFDEEVAEDTTDTQEGTAGQDSDANDTITFTIVRGMSSGQVSELLMQKGLVEDAVDFDDYIKENGKSTTIRFGSFVLPRNASYSEILATIAG